MISMLTCSSRRSTTEGALSLVCHLSFRPDRRTTGRTTVVATVLSIVETVVHGGCRPTPASRRRRCRIMAVKPPLSLPPSPFLLLIAVIPVLAAVIPILAAVHVADPRLIVTFVCGLSSPLLSLPPLLIMIADIILLSSLVRPCAWFILLPDFRAPIFGLGFICPLRYCLS